MTLVAELDELADLPHGWSMRLDDVSNLVVSNRRFTFHVLRQYLNSFPPDQIAFDIAHAVYELENGGCTTVQTVQ